MLKPYYTTLAFLFLWGIQCLHAQQPDPKIDSLRQLIDSGADDTSKVLNLLNLGKALSQTTPSKAIIYELEGLKLAEKLGFQKGMSGLHNSLGFAYTELAKYPTAMLHFLKADSLFQLRGDRYWQGLIHINIGRVYYYQNSYQLALRSWQKALKKLESQDRPIPKTMILSNLGGVYMEIDSFTQAEKYFSEALGIAEKEADKSNMMAIYGNLGLLKINDKKYLKAIEYLQKSNVLCRELGAENNLAINYQSLANAHLQRGETQQALIYCEQGLAIAEKKGMLLQTSTLYSLKAELYKKLKEYKKSNLFLKKYENLRDSIFGQEKRMLTIEMQRKFDTDQKERENQVLRVQAEIEQKQNQRERIFFLFIASLLLLVLFLIRNRFQIKRRAMAQEKAQLKALDEAKSRFFTNISHELRTPLSLILGPQEAAISEAAALNQTSLSAHLHKAQANAKKLKTMVDEILNLSKLESGKLKLTPIDVQLLPLLRRIFFSFDSLAKIRGLELIFDADLDENTWAKLDVSHFESILNNLISNALKHTARGGKITLAASQDSQSLALTLTDSGKGIPASELPFVFDRYYQSKQDSAQGGTGIGLALVKELVRIFGGNISIESQVGRGTSFFLDLPLVEGQASKTRAKSIEKPDSPPLAPAFIPAFTKDGSKAKLLIVEDNPEMAAFLKDLLIADYNCQLAADGKQALAALKKENFDLITSDVMMPEMNGFELLENLKADKELRQIPCILLTARALEEDKLRGLRLGVDDYLTKPFSAYELKARIHNLLTNKASRDEWLKENKAETQEITLSADEQLLQKAESFILKNISTPELKVGMLASELAMSERQLGRVIKKLSGLSPNQFIREIRLRRAQQLLEQQAYPTIADVGYQVGIDNPSYFSKLYLQRFGKQPSEV